MSTAAVASSNLLLRSRTAFSRLSTDRNRQTRNPFLDRIASESPRRIVLVSSRNSSRGMMAIARSGEGFDCSMKTHVHNGPSWDAVLAVTEALCIAGPAICSIMYLLTSVFPGASKHLQPFLNTKVFGWQFTLLVGAVAVGAFIRHRQWQRICRENGNATGVNLLARLEKVEEDMRSSVTIIRMLSRQLEKLGIRFRLTRKTLKDPISETAALARKNSEATRALALQEDNLEKELGEIQKVLLAMQEQQQKQLELILTIAKAGQLFQNKQGNVAEQGSFLKNNEILSKRSVNQVEVLSEQSGPNQSSS